MHAVPINRWLLVNFAGYPYAPNSFMPDNGLANLAGSLLDAGKEVLVLDGSTVSLLEEFSNARLRRRLGSVWDRIARSRHGLAGAADRLGALGLLPFCAAERQRLQDLYLERMARRIVRLADERGIEAVGFKLWNGDGLAGSARIARRVREAAPGLRILGGGPQVDIYMERFLDYHDEFDLLAYGEGEETIRELALRGGDPAAWATIPNLIFRDGGRVIRTESRLIGDLDRLPMPVYDPDVYPAMRGGEKVRIVVLDESRGCANHCAFCVHPAKSSRRLRTKGVPRLLDEILHLRKTLNAHTFRFGGSCTPYALLNAFAAAVLERGEQILYTSFAHVRNHAEADFVRMRQSGCVSLFFGLESGSQTILNRLQKGTRVEQIRAALHEARRAGIFSIGSLIYPCPGETAQTRAETLECLEQERPDALTVQAPVIAPRTDWFENPARYGIRFRNRDDYLARGVHWKLNLLLPVMFWKPLPVSVDGRSYKRVLGETGRFLRETQRRGFLTSVSDDTYLMSVRAEMPVHEFRDASRRAFFVGDAEQAAALADRVNARA